jgi:hypothetical protein
MRKFAVLLVTFAVVTACGGLKRTFGIKDAPPAHTEPRTTSIFGDWVLTNPDSTAFAGAQLVELSLQPTTFTLRAWYPTSADVATVTGTAAFGDGMLTLTPQGTLNGGTRPGFAAFVPGRPFAVLASAAGGSLVFAPPPNSEGSAIVPSSVWNKKAQAKAAGQVPSTQD